MESDLRRFTHRTKKTKRGHYSNSAKLYTPETYGGRCQIRRETKNGAKFHRLKDVKNDNDSDRKRQVGNSIYDHRLNRRLVRLNARLSKAN